MADLCRSSVTRPTPDRFRRTIGILRHGANRGAGVWKAMKVFHLWLIVPVLACAALAARGADEPCAAELFAERCASSHEADGGGAARIPSVSQLKAMTPTAILKALESG